jgi:hypothetical protein
MCLEDMSTKKNKISKNKKKQKSIRRTFVLFFLTFLSLLYTITSSWCGRFDAHCIIIIARHLVVKLSFCYCKITFVFYYSISLKIIIYCCGQREDIHFWNHVLISVDCAPRRRCDLKITHFSVSKFCLFRTIKQIDFSRGFDQACAIREV